MAKSLYIIDGHAHIYAAFYAPMKPLTSPSGEPTKASYIFTTMILNLIETKKPDMLVVAMDSKEPSFRRELYKEYKAHRPPMPDEMPVQINRIEEILEAMNVPVIRKSTFEADDIIGTLAAKAVKAGVDAYICSKDKDMLQLLDKGVCIYDIKTGTVTDAKSFKKDTGLEPEQFIDILALQGDAADNVPGVPDVGPKTALEWIKKYGSLDNLYKHADEITGKRGDNLRNSKDIAYLSKKLVTINCEMPVKLDEKTFAVSGFNNEKLAAIFGELGFSRLLTQTGLTPVENKETKDESIEEFALGAGQNSIKTVKHNYHLIDTPTKLDDFVDKLKKEKLFAVDTETTSISAHRAELVGMSFCWQAHEAYYLAVKGPLGAKYLELSAVRQKLASILADERVKKIFQNAKYDMIVLANCGMPVKGLFFDTMIASYVLEAERSHSLDNMAMDFLNYQSIPISDLIGKGKNQMSFEMVDTATACEYSSEDADMTFQLYQYLNERLEKEPKLKQLFEEMEMPLVEVLTKMELNGVKLDVPILKQLSIEINNQLEETTEKIYELAGGKFNVDSPKQLAEVLFERLGLQSVRSGKTGPSTDAGVLEELAGEHPVIEQILQHRQLSKLKNTYTDKLGALINGRTGRVHASFNQTITATGRLSSSDPNLQNIPIRTEIGKKIRAAFVPENKGDKIVSLDYSQIELRVLAHFSGDKAMIKAFQEDRDIHSFVASQIYNVDIKDVTSDMRSRCKAVNFGLIYGQGAFGLGKTTGMNMAEAKKFIDDYFARYKSIQQFKTDAIETAKRSGYAETICGRRRKISGLESRNGNVRSQAERLVINTLIQGSAADLIKIAMIRIQDKIEKEKLPAKMILQIHDELVFETTGKEAESLAKIFGREMTGAIKLNTPLKVDITIGKSWLAELP
ncbi:MAG: DNA polymerase I [Planctomycetes bacterium]|nr:DNA polymerase I [Planctomycetota bacterium]MBU1517483.1 DNA polymerase I [Planctomycetota bacterium]MBU2458591.1 DNA polymerase I [Planctomycetota bacterium]MBU2596061.1 DNA polymerase I [Planctomycetota bacterium]